MTSTEQLLLLTCPFTRCKGLNTPKVFQCIEAAFSNAALSDAAFSDAALSDAALSGWRSPTALDMGRGRTEDKLVRRSSIRDLSCPTTAVFTISSVFAMRRWRYRCRNML
jgi:hypothetical protein